MNPLRQYIDLYRQNEGLICSHSAPALNDRRAHAARLLENLTLPAAGSENYEHFDLNGALAPDYGINLAEVALDINPAASFRCDVPNMSTELFFTANERVMPAPKAGEALPEGVIAGSLREVARRYPELVAKYYDTLVPPTDAAAQLNTMLSQDGFVLYVPDGVRVEKPIQLVNTLAYAMPFMVCRRVLVIIGNNASARLLTCDHTQTQGVDFLNLQTVELFVGAHASLDLYDLEESSEQTTRISQTYLHQEHDSEVVISGMTLYNGKTRNEYVTSFAGPRAHLSLYGMGIADRRRVIDTYSHITHEATDCHTQEMVKYVADDEARTSFCGRIYVAPGATGTEAYQSNRNIIGSEKARVFSKPQLVILNDDVKCSHGSSTGSLDPQQIFYMRTRGLPEPVAAKLLKQAFMADIVDAIRIPALRDRLHLLVEKRFAGASGHCAGCTDCAH